MEMHLIEALLAMIAGTRIVEGSDTRNGKLIGLAFYLPGLVFAATIVAMRLYGLIF